MFGGWSDVVVIGKMRLPQAPSAQPVRRRQGSSGHHLTVNYRESYGLFAVPGIVQPRLPLVEGSSSFLAVTDGAAPERTGLAQRARRWGIRCSARLGLCVRYHASSRCGNAPTQRADSDYVIATGIGHTVRDLCHTAFERVGLEYEQHTLVGNRCFPAGRGRDQIGRSRALAPNLGWAPTIRISRAHIGMMVDADMERLRR